MRMKTQVLVLMFGALVPIACDPMQVDEGLFCANRIERDEFPHWGAMYALRNGEPWPISPWRGSLVAVSNDERETMSILMDVFEDMPPQPKFFCLSETLSIADVPRRLGIYPLPGRDAAPQGYFHTTDYCDVSGHSYMLDNSERGFISIDAYDQSACTIRGTFALTVIRDEPGGTYPYVDTLRFTKGRFYTHVATW